MVPRDETYGLFIDGEWQASEGGETIDAVNPATGDPIARIQSGTRTDASTAATAAGTVRAERWADETAFERASVCCEIAEAIRDDAAELASWLTRDQGKPIGESRVEIELCAREFEHAAEGVRQATTDVIPSADADKDVYTVREPHGVYGVITPWNFPANIPAEYIAPGLALGNTIVWVPAPTTSVIAAKLVEVIADTSLPDGALNLVTGDGAVVGNELVVSDAVDAIGFTGSPETGEAIASQAGLKPTVLELGGNGPVIVLDDADLEAAVDCAAAGSFGNAGQICSASERILVHESVAEPFRERMIQRAADVTLGDPRSEETDMGPLNNDDVAAKMDRHVADAIDRGATLYTGGERAEGFPTDRFYEPTVLGDVTTDMVVNREETFGPIAPIVTFADYDEAIAIANDIDLGLSSAVFTSNLDLLRYFTRNLETGVVNVNASSAHWEIHTPFGGYTGKRSGTGRVGGHAILEEMSQTKTVSVDYANADSPLR